MATIKWFAKSSGTTNAKSKFIPVSDEALEYCHLKAGKDMLCLYINNNEKTQLFTGKGLRLGGSSEVYQDRDSYFGDLSAIITTFFAALIKIFSLSSAPPPPLIKNLFLSI